MGLEPWSYCGGTVQEQLDAGHIAPASSLWNTPVFYVAKKSGKWRMLQDLRAVNAVIEPMGALQPGLPSPAMLPAGWPLMVIDLKDCFFTIFLHPSNAPHFAFSVPALNHPESMKRFHWVVLPQGMRNKPTICQTVVAKVIHPVRELYPCAMIYHYMDDTPVATAQETDLPPIMTALTNDVREAGLQVAPEKIQRTQSWAYLGWKITQQEIVPQPLKVKDTLTLHDLQ
ncbi:endogenous retrovirus group K member 25 Pol protein-like protein [Pitangus sulphuratus]|nr:endogenous retrovirus group K member 25 Pol protein-like protein [Pitangus sulphuratus]